MSIGFGAVTLGCGGASVTAALVAGSFTADTLTRLARVGALVETEFNNSEAIGSVLSNSMLNMPKTTGPSAT
jgi:hypothetical protein